MFRFESRGSFKKTEAFLKEMQKNNLFKNLEGLAQEGVNALEKATPVDSGLAANSWNYDIQLTRGGVSIFWTNDDIENGFPVAVMIQYGHGTGTGGYVQGIDYINPAIRPTFDKIADKVWKAVTSA